MYIFLRNNDYRYAAEQMLLMLFPEERPVYPSADPGLREENAVELELKHGKTYTTAVCRLRYDRRTVQKHVRARTDGIRAGEERARIEQRILKLAFYRAALDVGVPKPEWGCLTGVRPAKFLAGLMQKDGLTETAAVRMLTETFGVSKERASLALAAERAAARAKAALAPQDVCLYIGIPFCPTRCAYCSFVSVDAPKLLKSIPDYLNALEQEMRSTAAAVKAAGRRIVAVYIGGGTPTSLSADQLRQLMGTVRANFDLSKVVEYTVEAGRPDCTDAEKLAVIKEYGATRISINPQTFSDEVLANIGRKHSAQDILDCYADARRAGHDDINMDLIAGLPGDTVEGFEHSLRQAIALDPENITVHTLTLKRASRIVIEDQKENDYADVAAMLEKCHLLAEAGYRPYYLYRQKNTLQNLENVGWCKPGHEGYYNIYIMEEVQTILSAGAGGSTKLVADGGKRMQRIFNFKYPTEYIQRFAEVLERKKGVADFYDHDLGPETSG